MEIAQPITLHCIAMPTDLHRAIAFASARFHGMDYIASDHFIALSRFIPISQMCRE